MFAKNLAKFWQTFCEILAFSTKNAFCYLLPTRTFNTIKKFIIALVIKKNDNLFALKSQKICSVVERSLKNCLKKRAHAGGGGRRVHSLVFPEHYHTP
jgi:hypothetical protein